MWRVAIHPEWRLARGDAVPLALPPLLRLLARVQTGGSIAAAAREIGLSYRAAWGLLRDFEQALNAPLVVKTRGQGTQLSALAEKLLWADRRVAARLSPTLESLASELESELEALIAPARSGIRINASHGFAVAALLELLNQRQVPVELKYRNSTEAVAALARRECDFAGFHVAVGAHQAASVRPYLQWLDPEQHVLIHLALRTQGLLVARGNRNKIRTVADLARPELRFVNRQVGSGTRVLLDLLLAQQGIAPSSVNGYANAEFTHAAVAAYIASGMADVGFGLETAARRFQLDFLPLLRERYFFACGAAALRVPATRGVVELLRSDEMRNVINALPGYDGSDAGKVVGIKEAFKPPPEKQPRPAKKARPTDRRKARQ